VENARRGIGTSQEVSRGTLTHHASRITYAAPFTARTARTALAVLAAAVLVVGCRSAPPKQRGPTSVFEIFLPFMSRVLSDQERQGRWKLLKSGPDDNTTDSVAGHGYFRRTGIRKGLVKKAKEAEFMNTLRAGISGILINTNVTILKREASPDHLQFAYTDGTTLGSVDIWGVRGPGEEFTLVIAIYES
jgi:hypothetical protein